MTNQKKTTALIIYIILFYALWTVFELFAKGILDSGITNVICRINRRNGISRLASQCYDLLWGQEMEIHNYQCYYVLGNSFSRLDFYQKQKYSCTYCITYVLGFAAYNDFLNNGDYRREMLSPKNRHLKSLHIIKGGKNQFAARDCRKTWISFRNCGRIISAPTRENVK